MFKRDYLYIFIYLFPLYYNFIPYCILTTFNKQCVDYSYPEKGWMRLENSLFSTMDMLNVCTYDRAQTVKRNLNLVTAEEAKLCKTNTRMAKIER